MSNFRIEVYVDYFATELFALGLSLEKTEDLAFLSRLLDYCDFAIALLVDWNWIEASGLMYWFLRPKKSIEKKTHKLLFHRQHRQSYLLLKLTYCGILIFNLRS